MRARRSNKRRLPSYNRLCCLTTTGTNDHHISLGTHRVSTPPADPQLTHLSSPNSQQQGLHFFSSFVFCSLKCRLGLLYFSEIHCPFFLFRRNPLNAERSLLFSGARPSLRRPWEDRIFDTADTARHRTPILHRSALQAEWQA